MNQAPIPDHSPNNEPQSIIPSDAAQTQPPTPPVQRGVQAIQAPLNSSEQAASEQAASEQAASEQAASERASSNQTADDTPHHEEQSALEATSGETDNSESAPAPLPEIQETKTLADDDDEPFAHAKYGFAAVVCIYFMYQFAGGALHAVARNRSIAFDIVLQGIGQVLFMLIPAILVMRYSPLRRQGLMRSGGEITPMQWIFGLLGIFGIQIFDAGFIAVQERVLPSVMMPVYQQLRVWSDMVEQFYRTSFAGTTPLEAVRALIIGAVVPAFAEEILFRGVLQRSLEAVYPSRRAIVMTAILFGALHFNPLSLFPLILIGAYLGFLAYYTQSLALPIVAHFLSNAIAIVALYAPGQGMEMSPYGISMGRGLLLILLGASIFTGAYLLIQRFTPRVPAPKQQYDEAE